MRKTIYIISVLLLLLVVLIIFSRQFFLPQFLSTYFSKQLKAEVGIEKVSLNLINSIEAKGVSISNQRGLKCDIESARVEYDIISVIKDGLNFKFKLKSVKLSYPDSRVINSIAEFLSIKTLDRLQFDYAEGRFYRKKRELIIRSLNATGKLISFFADGTIAEGSRIDYSFRVLLSDKLVANIPDSVRKVFFKQDGSWSEVELYVTGDIEHPSINFSTDLFRLKVR